MQSKTKSNIHIRDEDYPLRITQQFNQLANCSSSTKYVQRSELANLSSISKILSKNINREDWIMQSTKELRSSLIPKQCLKSTNRNFVSIYGKKTRYEEIMDLKVNVNYKSSTKEIKQKVGQSQDNKENLQTKQNRSRNKNRLDQIMQIKLEKPKVNSFLKNYQPKLVQRQLKITNSKQQEERLHVCERRQMKQRVEQQKEYNSWKMMEKERQKSLLKAKEQEQRNHIRQRRVENRFELMLTKQLIKIQSENELIRRKTQGFAHYIYPYH